MRTYKKVCKLPAGRPRLREQFRDCGLQQFVGEQKAWFERHAMNATRIGFRLDRNVLDRLVEKPVDIFLENVGDYLHQFL